jgi:hypothetical protein
MVIILVNPNHTVSDMHPLNKEEELIIDFSFNKLESNIITYMMRVQSDNNLINVVYMIQNELGSSLGVIIGPWNPQ